LIIKRLSLRRFLYINIYAFLIVFAGILALILPFYLITKWILIAQIIVAINLFLISGKLFSAWNSKKREIELLVNRNKNEFRPDTFEVYMRTLCGRLVVHEALRELNIQREYKTLQKLKKTNKT